MLRLDFAEEEMHTDTVVEGWLPPRGEDIEFPGSGTMPGNLGRALRDATSGFTMPVIFEPPLLAGLLPDGGIVHSDSSTYVLKITPPDGSEPTRVMRMTTTPVGGSPTGPVESSTVNNVEPRFYPEIPVLWSLSTTWKDASGCGAAATNRAASGLSMC